MSSLFVFVWLSKGDVYPSSFKDFIIHELMRNGWIFSYSHCKFSQYSSLLFDLLNDKRVSDSEVFAYHGESRCDFVQNKRISEMFINTWPQLAKNNIMENFHS